MHGVAPLDRAQSFSQSLRSPSHHYIMIPLEERTRQRRQHIHPKLRRLDLPVITCKQRTNRCDNQAYELSYENFHHINSAPAAGRAKINRKIGSSSATEYPALVTPTHILNRAATIQIGMKSLAAATIGCVPAPPINRPAKTDRPSSTKPPRMIIIVRIAAGVDGKLIASLLVGLPYVVLARKDIKRPADLKGKIIGVTRPGEFTYRLAKEFLKKFNLSDKEVKLSTVGGTPTERYSALAQDIFQATLIQPPLDARGKKDGFNVIYNLNDLGFPFIYSSLFTNSKTLKDKPALVQKVVAGLAETIHFVEKNPPLAMAAVGKTLRINDQDTLQSAYDAYANRLINRRMIVPVKQVAETVEIAREEGAVFRRKPAEIFDNTFVENLDRSGFLRELWGGAVP